MSNERDELEKCFTAYGVGRVDSRVLADALIQFGYRKQRTITTTAAVEVAAAAMWKISPYGWRGIGDPPPFEKATPHAQEMHRKRARVALEAVEALKQEPEA